MQKYFAVNFATLYPGKKSWLACFVVFFLSATTLFSQTVMPGPFNAPFWNGYADKLNLGPQERAEFMASHRARHAADSADAVSQATQQVSGNRVIQPPATLFAGPCVNADFELGSVTGWTVSSGFHPGYNSLGCCPNSNGQQTIMTGGNDPYGGFPRVYPGGNFSLRLGNDGVNGEADRIEQTFLVTAANANFSYRYAVVFEDPSHPLNQQPFFQVDLLDAAKAPVPCTAYFVAASSGIPGFLTSTTSGTKTVIYKPWTTVLIDLTPYIGQAITIRFSTYDCSLGGHFGYAYIDGVCQSFDSGSTQTVCAGSTATFCAPSGVNSYTWNGPGLTNFTGQCATASAPGIYTVTTTLFTGCPGPNFTYTLSSQTQQTATAGPPSTVCANNNTVSLSGSITGYSATPVWSSSGTGVFTSTGNINTSYVPSAADNAAGSVTITLTTGSNGACPAATDNLVISITPSPAVNAGTGGSVCNNTPFALNGSVTGAATTGSWTTSGSGSFSPSTTDLNASYTPDAADIAAGSVTLTLTSTNYGICSPVSDTVIVLIKKLMTANAGVNQALCSTSPSVALSGTVGGGSSTGAWGSSGPGGFTPSANNLNTTYAITAADRTAGEITFTLTSTNNGPCPAVTDTVKMVIIQPATVTAGPNQFLCATAGSINLSGSVTGLANTGIWTGNGSGLFTPGATAMNTSYSLTPADITAGTVSFTLTSTGNGPCAAVRDSVMMRVRRIAQPNAGANQVLCSNTGAVNLAGTMSGGTTTGAWTSSGPGAFTPNNTSLNTAYGITPADIATGSMIFTLTSTNNGPCVAVEDTVMIKVTNIATITAGPNLYVCSNASTLNLAGTINSPSNTVAWGTAGTGNFMPNATTANTTYSFSAADVTAGTVIFTITSTNNGVCPAVNDTVKMRLMKLATVNAGLNQALCSNTTAVLLQGSVAGSAGTGVWSTGGGGAFTPGNLTTPYSITQTDINNGFVTFTLSSTNNGPCPIVNDSVMITVTKIATITAGPNLYVCSNASTLNLAGAITSPSNTAVWSSDGTGSFQPNNSAVNNTYSFSAADVAAGTVIFTITSTNNGVCPAVTDTAKMRLMKLAAVSAGTHQAICSNTNAISLQGSVIGSAGTGVWSTDGAGGFTPNNSSLNTAYAITSADINNGLVSFTLSSTNNGPCPVVSNTVDVAISKIATVTAGNNQYVCSSQNSITLNGTVIGSTSTGSWSASGTGGFLPNSAALTADYPITANDITNGSVIFTLTSTGNGVCPAVSDTVKMKILRVASVSAGTNQALCSNAGTIALSGSVTGSNGTGIWTSNGIGAFSPNNSLLATSYSITQGDISAGFVTFTLSSSNNGPCAVVANTMSVSISPIATVSAGNNQFICSSQGSVSLGGTVNGVTSAGQWSSSGAGIINPSNTSLNGSYLLTPADVVNGTVTFTLSSTNNGVCPVVRDSVMMRVMRLATVNAGVNQALCSNAGTIALQGITAGGNNAAAWSASGPGAFIPTNTLLATNYSITPTDISSGQVIFTLSSTGGGPCPVVNDTVKITLRLIASVNAGVNQFICSSQNSITLNGSVTGGASNGQWSSSGSGNFSPGITALSTSYALTSLDILNGSVTFSLISTGNGVCPAVRDTALMKIRLVPTVNAGANQLICSSAGVVNLNGIVNGGGFAGSWTTNGNGVFNSNSTTASYALSPQDISAGSLQFVFSSQGSAPCTEATGSVNVTISNPAQVSAGSSQTICSNSGSINLSGTNSGGSGTVIWTSNGTGGFTPANTAPVTNYVLSQADISAGAVNFTLTSTNNGGCAPATSSVTVVVHELAHVNAGTDKAICSSQLQVPLQGVISGITTSGSWSSTGTGTFSPNAPAGSYSVSSSDLSQSPLYMVLTSVDNGVCPVVTDTMKLSFETKPVIVVGADTTVCEKSSLITLNASATGTGIQWSTSGSGTFLPSNALSATHYSLSAGDKASGNISLILGTTNNNGACGYTGSTMHVFVLPVPQANFVPSTYTVTIPDQVLFSNASVGASTYSWSFGDGDTSSLTSPLHKYTGVGYYKVILMAGNGTGCGDTTEQVITVISDVKVPTAFTPNVRGGSGGSYNPNDGTNDVFFLFAEADGITKYDMMIFNRWGELIFKSNDAKIGWDGYFNGKLCQQDAYVWIVNMEFFDGRKYNKTGSITLLR